MASAGDHFQMPDGSVYIVRRPAADSGGEFVEMCRSLPFSSSIFLSRSLNVAFIVPLSGRARLI